MIEAKEELEDIELEAAKAEKARKEAEAHHRQAMQGRR